jgi:AraC family transcriptional regulator of adaptative response/methylated-DNA-[protein]-cysteine methyltransferase
MNQSVWRHLPTEEEMWRAFIERDAAFDGIFLVGVTSTHIFCRPTCVARKPKRENVLFFATASDAMYAGFRACLRCKPMDAEAARPPLVDALVARIEREPSLRIRERDLIAEGIDPSTVRRQFLRYFGMSFQAYSRARRMGAALGGLRHMTAATTRPNRTGALREPIPSAARVSVIHQQLDAAFDSSSGYRDAFHRLFGTQPSRASDVVVLFAEWLETPLGPMLAIANDAGLHVLDWVNRRGLEREIVRLRKRTQGVIVPGQHPILAEARRQIGEYFLGARRTFDLPVETHGTPFQRAVWAALKALPHGTITSYSALAGTLGVPRAVRAVARANGDNFRSIVVPCHRVVGVDGALTGYGGGLARKQWLLDFERAA